MTRGTASMHDGSAAQRQPLYYTTRLGGVGNMFVVFLRAASVYSFRSKRSAHLARAPSGRVIIIWHYLRKARTTLAGIRPHGLREVCHRCTELVLCAAWGTVWANQSQEQWKKKYLRPGNDDKTFLLSRSVWQGVWAFLYDINLNDTVHRTSAHELNWFVFHA